MSVSMNRALGRKVMALDTATEIGEIKAFVVDQPPRFITALHVTGWKRSPELVNWTEVTGFGPDKVMVSSAEALREPTQEREEDQARHKIDLLGSRVLFTDGFEGGEVAEVEFDAETGALISVSAADRTIPVASCRSIGTYALVVDADQRT